MKQTLNKYQAADELRSDENASWSYAGALALVEYLDELGEDLGEEIELDVVAIRCDYSEYATLDDWASDYMGADEYANMFGNIEDEDDRADEIRAYIEGHGTLIEFDGGVIVSSF